MRATGAVGAGGGAEGQRRHGEQGEQVRAHWSLLGLNEYSRTVTDKVVPYRYGSRCQGPRQTIRDAAEKLFLAQGYAATSIAAIAEEAGVAPETVYATFKNKRALLKELIDVRVAGDDEPIAINDRPWLDEIRAEPDQRRA